MGRANIGEPGLLLTFDALPQPVGQQHLINWEFVPLTLVRGFPRILARGFWSFGAVGLRCLSQLRRARHIARPGICALSGGA